MAEVLLCTGGKAHAVDRTGRTPLHWAAFKGHSAVLALLTARPEVAAGLHLGDKTGATALHAAAAAGAHNALAALLEAVPARAGSSGASPRDHQQRTPLHVAVAAEHAGSVQVLLQFQADVAVVDANGQTPLSLASRQGATDLVKLLLEHGANGNVQVVF